MKLKIFILTTSLLLPLKILAADSTILINEVAWMGNETSANNEWLELKNTTGNEIDLAGWQLAAADGTPSITLIGKIPANGFYLLERTGDQTLPAVLADQIYSGALSNTGEWLKLFNSAGILIDQINGTEGWPGGDNSTKQTMERDSALSWQSSAAANGTPKAENSIWQAPGETPTATSTPPATGPSVTTPAPEPLSEPNEPVSRGDIMINEIFANPAGVDTEEFIEIKNISKYAVDVSDWKITNIAKDEFFLPSLIMGSGSLAVFYRQQSHLALNNIKEKLTLYSKAGRIIDQVECKSPAEEGASYQKSADDYWGWAKITPAEENIYKKEILPVATIYGPKEAAVFEFIEFDASDSFDPLNRPLTYRWQFGDGRIAEGVAVRQLYNMAGGYKVSLNVIASQTASTTEDFKITITNPDKDMAPTTTATSTVGASESYAGPAPLIFISEIMPNPVGPDNQEFIELISKEGYTVNLGGFKITDSSNKTYTIAETTLIKPGQHLAFYKEQTKISLNNDRDVISLLSPDNIIMDQFEYDNAEEGASFIIDKDFSIKKSSTPTPGAPNISDNEPTPDDELKKESPSTTPQVLGAEIDLVQNQSSQNKIGSNTKYIAAIIALAIAIGLFILKLKKNC